MVHHRRGGVIYNKRIALKHARNVSEGHALHDFAIMANQRGEEVETSRKPPRFGVLVAAGAQADPWHRDIPIHGAVDTDKSCRLWGERNRHKSRATRIAAAADDKKPQRPQPMQMRRE